LTLTKTLVIVNNEIHKKRQAMIAYIYLAPTLPTRAEQLAAIGPYDVLYEDKGKRTHRPDMVRAATLRGEDVRIATAAVLGSGDDMRKAISHLSGHGITLHIADIGESIELNGNAVITTDLAERAKANNMSNRGRLGYNAAGDKLKGRPRATTPEQDATILRMAKTHKVEEIAVNLGLSFATVCRRMKEQNTDLEDQQ
jgi:hypothetical protein